MAVDRNVAVSGVAALPGAAAIALWMLSFRVPSLLGRDDLIPLDLVVLSLSVVALLVTAVQLARPIAGCAWHCVRLADRSRDSDANDGR